MSKISRIGSVGIFALIAALAGLGCGSGSTNNDQGTSFLAFGFFQDAMGDVGATGAIVPLFFDRSGQGGLGPVDGNAVLTFMGVQNRLTNQFIRLVRIDCAYNIPGSNLQIPDDSFNFSTVVGPADPDAVGDEVLANTSFGQFFIVSTDIISFINVNQNSLPQLPFRMIATCSATGVTQAGDTLTTNELLYPITFVDFEECCTGTGVGGGGGFQLGEGTGGDITFAEDGAGAGAAGAPVGAAGIEGLDDLDTDDDGQLIQ